MNVIVAHVRLVSVSPGMSSVIQRQSALCPSLESVVDDGIDDDHRHSMVTVDVLVIVLTLMLFGTAAGAAIRIDRLWFRF